MRELILLSKRRHLLLAVYITPANFLIKNFSSKNKTRILSAAVRSNTINIVTARRAPISTISIYRSQLSRN